MNTIIITVAEDVPDCVDGSKVEKKEGKKEDFASKRTKRRQQVVKGPNHTPTTYTMKIVKTVDASDCVNRI